MRADSAAIGTNAAPEPSVAFSGASSACVRLSTNTTTRARALQLLQIIKRIAPAVFEDCQSFSPAKG